MCFYGKNIKTLSTTMDLPTAQLTGPSPACDSYETLTKTWATNTKWLEWASDNDGNRDDLDLETRAVA